MRLFLHKVFHWEYWPFYIVYIPIYFLWAYYALRQRTIFFFNAANPTIRNGGFINESKKEIYDLIPPQYYPKTILVAKGTTPDQLRILLEENGLQFPLIAKPDIGLRGSAVKKADDFTTLEDYALKADFDFLVQELIPYENEIGIFYVRFPGDAHGRITGIVAKEFLIVTGDGQSTLEQLLKANPRHELQLRALQREYGAQLQRIPAEGEKVNLVPYGNHARGAKFVDRTHWATPALNAQIDAICQQVPGFYFGRIDLMYRSLAELEQGQHFAIVELNGAGSEPTHIYDPKHSLFFAWKELARHISYMYRISVANHRNGVRYLGHKEGMAEYREHNRHFNKIIQF